MKNPILLIFLLVICYVAPAQKVAAIPDKNKILIGEPIQLHVFGEFAQGQAFSWFSADSILHFEVLEKSKIDTVESAGILTVKQTLTITSWDSGKWEFPSLVIGKMSTTPFKVDVGYSPMEPNQDYNDIKDIIPVEKPKESKWYWYFIAIIVLIALFFLFFPPEQKKQIDPSLFIPDTGAYQLALLQLNQLEAEELRDDKLFYTRLVNILREYLHKRKNIKSFSKTTDDLGIQVKKLDIEHHQYTSLLQTLRLSDLVKYARFQSTGEDRKNSISTIRQTIMIIENPNAVQLVSKY